MGIAVLGRIVRGDLSRLLGLQVIQVKSSARLIHDGRLVARPARVGKPDLLALLVGKGLGVGDHGSWHRNRQGTKYARNLALESLLVLKQI